MQGEDTPTLAWFAAQGPGPSSAAADATTSAATSATAVALVVHGLNVEPQRMRPIIQALTGNGLEVFNVALHGHGGNYLHQPGVPEEAARLDALRRVSASLWRDELHAAYRVAALRAAQLGGVPICFVGYSLGALVGCDLFADAPDVHFAKMVLFAPALQIHPLSYALRLLGRSPHMVIRSASPRAYRANPGTSIAAYSALYATVAHFAARAGSKINVPALLLIDQQDELVSYPKTRRLLMAAGLTNWQLQTVTKGPGAIQRYHHLLIDAQSVGPQQWEAIVASVAAHLRSVP